jgi:hypothetical protein
VKLDQLARFDASSTELVEAAAQFITAINTNRDLPQAREKFSRLLAAQIAASDQLKEIDARQAASIDIYETTISDFNIALKNAASPADMGPWVERFGHMLDTKGALSKRFHSDLGVSG